MMKKQRRKFTKEFKLKLILEALKERSTVKELCQKYELHPNQITNWKQDFLNKASETMDAASTKNKEEELESEKEKLYSKIGQLQMEVDFLKKKLS